MRKAITSILIAAAATAFAGTKQEVEVIFKSNISCDNCKNRIMRNLPFEKGVKAIDVNLDDKTAAVRFRKDKNSTENLNKALDDLGYKSVVIEEKEVAKTGKK